MYNTLILYVFSLFSLNFGVHIFISFEYKKIIVVLDKSYCLWKKWNIKYNVNSN